MISVMHLAHSYIRVINAKASLPLFTFLHCLDVVDPHNMLPEG